MTGHVPMVLTQAGILVWLIGAWELRRKGWRALAWPVWLAYIILWLSLNAVREGRRLRRKFP